MNQFDTILRLMPEAVRDPRETAVSLLSLGIPREAVWLLMAAVATGEALIISVTELLSPTDNPAISPLLLAPLLFVIFTAFAISIWKVGEAFGGTGKLTEALLTVAFVQTLLLIAQVGQLILMMIAPLLGALMFLAILIWSVWLNAAFVDALHGFAALGKSLAVFILASFAVALALAIITQMIGIDMLPTGGT